MIPDNLLKSARILVADDEVTSVRLLERLLARAGYGAVVSTTEPERVIELYRSTRPDLLILDLHMPGMTGYEVMEQIQEEVGDEYVPVIMLTGDIRNETRLRALAVGVRDFLTKPFDPVEAMLRIRNLLEARFLALGMLSAGRGAAG